MKPKPYRGFTKNGKEVKGWYCKYGRQHFIFDPKHRMQFLGCFIEVLPETVGQFVCTDKNGKDVFVGDRAKWKQPDKIAAETYGEYEEVEAVAKGGFLFWDVDGSTFCPADEIGDIELLEEKK